MTSFLITGGAGFVGATLALRFKAAHPEARVIALDNLKRRGSELNLPRLRQAGVEFVHGDIRNQEDFDALPPVEVVIEASAEPSVLAGVTSAPDYLVNTNLLGTINCLNYTRRHGAAFIFLSTSRVYPINQIERIALTEGPTRFEIAPEQSMPGISAAGLAESFPLEGYRSLYGATKLCSEYLIQEYHHFYGLRTVINRCGVLAGPWQMGKVDQGVVVLWAARHFWQQELGYIGFGGTGKQVRDVLHVDDLYDLLEIQLANLASHSGQTYNVGGGHAGSVSLQELTVLCQEITGHQVPIHAEAETRPADIALYLTDNARVTAATGWAPRRSVRTLVEDVYQWLRAHEAELKPILGQ
ncbi:NAD-dependent epimerase/dehydratase family protein [Hymenobacter ginsengisoli]|uniref:NAD-dependent epimerase/dehydratase family protein n=1 Tax=Hymenobacter ginsengisoli TaxID=1051626 RepID=A0ABP8PXL0_9BACT|nr:MULTISPECIES: NAD-dependent epimerase/dehydratase family protein [unclassified Hymenobacter]MBO2030552.1 NAD-dependent epimerase/dehydratase family protein [Hymenobacter sp. BT559]